MEGCDISQRMIERAWGIALARKDATAHYTSMASPAVGASKAA